MLGDPARAASTTTRSSRDETTTRRRQVHVVAATATCQSSFPWRFLAGMAAVGIAFVVLGVITYEPSPPGPPDRLLEPGSCVVIEDNGDAAEVNCEPTTMASSKPCRSAAQSAWSRWSRTGIDRVWVSRACGSTYDVPLNRMARC